MTRSIVLAVVNVSLVASVLTTTVELFKNSVIFIFAYLSDWHDFPVISSDFSSDFSVTFPVISPTHQKIPFLLGGDSKALRLSNMIQLLLLSRYFQLVRCLNIVSGRTLIYLQYKERIRLHPVQLDLCVLVLLTGC